MAPVTRRSGKSRAVTRRLACNPRLRNAIHYLADAARRCDEKSKARYLALKTRGCSHARALRTIGDRLLYVVCAMLKNRTLFDPGLGKPKMRLINRVKCLAVGFAGEFPYSGGK